MKRRWRCAVVVAVGLLALATGRRLAHQAEARQIHPVGWDGVAAASADGPTRPRDGAAVAPPDGGYDGPDGGPDAAEGPEKMVITVGAYAELRLGYPIIEAICDDTTVVRVEDGGDHLRLRGLAVGTTLCGFWKQKSPRPQRLIEVQVIPAPPASQPK